MQGSLLGHLMHHGMFGFGIGIRDVGHARDALSLFLSLSFCLWTSPDATVETSQVCMDVDVVD